MSEDNKPPEEPKAEERKIEPAPPAAKPERKPVTCDFCKEEIGKAKTEDEAKELFKDHLRDCKERPKGVPLWAILAAVAIVIVTAGFIIVTDQDTFTRVKDGLKRVGENFGREPGTQ